MNLAKILQDQVGPTLIHKASSTLGMDSDVVSGAVSKLLPSVVGLLGKKAATPEGAAGLFKSLTQGTAADLFNSDEVGALTQGLSKMSELPTDKAESLLKLGTPVIASKMKWLIESEKLSADDFTNVITAQADHLKDFDLEGVLGKVGLGGAVAGAAGAAAALKDKATDAVSGAVDSAKSVADKAPEDSVLKRHYEQAKSVADSATDVASDAASKTTGGAVKAAAAGAAGIAAAAGALKSKATDAVDGAVDSAKNLGDNVPEDSVLRRHHEQANSVAKNTTDTVSDSIDSATSGASKTAAAAGAAALGAAGAATAGAAKLGSKATEKASDAVTGAASKASSAVDATTDAVSKTASAAVPDAPSKTGMGWGKILGFLALIAAIIWGLFTCQKTTTPDVVAEVVEAPAEVAEEIIEEVEEAVTETVEVTEEATTEAVVEEAEPTEAVEEAVEEVAEETAEVVEEVVVEATEATEAVVEEAPETVVEEVKETMGEATEAVTSGFGAAKAAVETATSDFGAATAVAAVTGTVTTAVAAVREVTLPGGGSISLNEGSPVDQIVTFLQNDNAELPQSFILHGLNFRTSSAQITDESINIIDDLSTALKAYNNVKISLEGHTDSRGVAEANLALSEARAESVLNTLTTKGIARDRMVAKGHGPAEAIADNATAEGRQENRRVEVIITER